MTLATSEDLREHLVLLVIAKNRLSKNREVLEMIRKKMGFWLGLEWGGW